MKAVVLISGFCTGIALVSFLPLGWWLSAFLLLLSVSFLFLMHVRHAPAYFIGALFFLAGAVGVVRTEFAVASLPPEFTSFLGSEVTLEGKVVADPDIRETTARLTLRTEHEGVYTNVLVVAPLFPQVKYGEIIRVHGMLEAPEAFSTDSGRIFRYDAFLAKDGIYAVLRNASLERLAPRSGILDTVRGFFSDLKFNGIDALSVALPEPEASLAAGLVLGGKQGLGDTLLTDFITVGLVHIVVLSGYNVMIVAEAVFRMFALMARRIAAPAAGVVIFAFVLCAGAGAASVRAGIMASVALFARASGRTYDALRALFAAALLMLLWNPLILIHDPGFQLSFVATLGLIFGAPITERWFYRIRPAFLREVVSATVAAQISVLPLLLYQNGLFSLIALPVNALVLPFVPLTMAFSAFAGFIGFLLPALAPLAGLPAYALLWFMVNVVEVAARLPGAALSVPAFPFMLVPFVYGALGIFVWRDRTRSRVPKIVSLARPNSRL